MLVPPAAPAAPAAAPEEVGDHDNTMPPATAPHSHTTSQRIKHHHATDDKVEAFMTLRGRADLSGCILACMQGNLGMCKRLLDRGSLQDLGKGGDKDNTLMHSTCCCGHVDVCQWLWDHGAAEDVTRQNDDGDTPMQYACQNGHVDVCQWLWDH